MAASERVAVLIVRILRGGILFGIDLQIFAEARECDNLTQPQARLTI